MPQIKSIEELQKIREQVKDMINLRVDNEKRLSGCRHGTCGIAASARPLCLQFR